MKALVQVVGLLPRNACVLVLRAYRAVVSPLYGDVCRYHPSCSRYALESIQLHGVIAGVALGSWRILRCNPWAKGGVDDPPRARHDRHRVTDSGFVVPRRATSSSSTDGRLRPLSSLVLAAPSHRKG